MIRLSGVSVFVEKRSMSSYALARLSEDIAKQCQTRLPSTIDPSQVTRFCQTELLVHFLTEHLGDLTF